MRHAALVLTYNRPASTVKICENLVALGVVDIYVSIDGGKNETEKLGQEKLIARLHDLSKQHKVRVSVRHANKNIGVSAGVISGIDWFFNQVEFGYILEDDLIFNQDFLDFCDLGFEKFKDEPAIWMISGNQYLDSKPECIWTNYPLIWGWATWASKWYEFRNSLFNNQFIIGHGVAKYPVRQFWKISYMRAMNGILDSWAVLYASQMRACQGLSLLPPVNLVANVGVDRFASHTRRVAWHTGWKIGILLDYPSFENYWSSIPENRNIIAQNELLEERIYKIGFRHYFANIYSCALDSFRFTKGKNLEDRLIEAGKKSSKYYSYDCQ